MSKKIQLHIADPCHENWEQMTPVEKGRFCGSCQKQVVDFSNMSDREMAMFFKKPSTGSVCGRFMNDQLDRDVEMPKKRIPWVKYFFQFALQAFLLSLKVNSQNTRTGKSTSDSTQPTRIVNAAKKDTLIMPEIILLSVSKVVGPNFSSCPMTGPVSITEVKKIQLAQSVKPIDIATISTVLSGTVGMISVDVREMTTVKGKVTDEFGVPIYYASVVVKGTSLGTPTDENGDFSLTIQGDDRMAELIVSSVGYSVEHVKVNNADKIVLVKLQTSVTGAVVVVKRINKTGKQKKEKKQEKRPKPVARLEIYPNPVHAGSTLNIGCRNMENGYYTFQLFNISGQSVHQRELWVDEKATVLNIEMPKLAAGTYLLQFTNKQSGKVVSEKVVVQ